MADSEALYVGCGLTQAPEDFRAGVEEAKQALRAVHGHEVYDFVGLVNGTARDVYEYDIGKCVTKCAAFAGIVDFESIGLGWELRTAHTLNKPTLTLHNIIDGLPPRLSVAPNQLCMRDKEVFVANCGDPSTALGWELAAATEQRKPTLAIAPVDARVTRLVLGAADVIPHMSFERYETPEHAGEIIDRFLTDTIGRELSPEEPPAPTFIESEMYVSFADAAQKISDFATRALMHTT